MIACELEDLFDETCPVCSDLNQRQLDAWQQRLATSVAVGPEPLVLQV
ncbi:MAG: hypothetical protein ACLGIR_07740 [Actinomycetes bacterium]|jgi:hypothetical protein